MDQINKNKIRIRLYDLKRDLNDFIDFIIPLRDGEVVNKQTYRYVTRKLEQALGKIHEAQEKIENIS